MLNKVKAVTAMAIALAITAGVQIFSVHAAPITGTHGNPVLLQSRFGRTGNFEIVAPFAAGGLLHLWRDNDHPEMPWHQSAVFGTGFGTIHSVSLIESNFGTPGNLEIVARAGDRLLFAWFDGRWNGPVALETLEASTPPPGGGTPPTPPVLATANISVDRGCGSFYNAGDALTVSYNISAPATITVYDFDPAGILSATCKYTVP